MASAPKKRGKLSLEEEKFIRDNHKNMTLKDIAEAINRTIEPVEKFIVANGLTVNTQEADRNLIKKKLLAKFFWKSVEAQLTEDEVDFFINGWVEMIEQFNEDVTPTEEQQIKQYLMCEILKNRCGILRKKEMDAIAQWEKQIQGEEDSIDPDMMKIENLQRHIGLAKANLQSYATESEKYQKTSQDLMKDLKGTRDQRFKKVEAGQTTFTSIIKFLSDRKNAEQEGREIELLRLAAEKKRKELYDYHQYGDGQLDPPILNYESQTMLEERENQDDTQDQSEEENKE
jgi:hypothetical protein